MIFISWSRECGQLRLRKQLLFVKIIIDVNYFHKTLCKTFWIGLIFWIGQCSEYTEAQNKPGFWIRFWCWICQGSGYTTVKMSGLHKVLKMPEYVWIIHGYAWLCLNKLKSVWMAFVLHLFIVILYLKETYTVFLKSKNLIFPIVAGSIWFCVFLEWIFLQVRFQIHCYFCGPRVRESWYIQ